MRKLLSISVASGLLLTGAAVYVYQISQPGTVRMRFDAVIGDQPLVFNDARYSNPGGAGMFRIRDFQFFISNIDLHGEKGVYRVPDSYYLARFENSSTSYQIDLTKVSRDSYSAVTFSIGVDEVANGSIMSVGDLDPNSRMAWNWEVGYKFLLFEGALIDGDVDIRFCDFPTIPAGSVGRLILGVMAQIAEFERGVISERTKAAMAAAKARGMTFGNPCGAAPLVTHRKRGARNSQKVRIAKADEFARRLAPIIADIHDGGIDTAKGIARELNERDIQASRGGVWSGKQVRRVLERLE